jgi:hypothetical protein
VNGTNRMPSRRALSVGATTTRNADTRRPASSADCLCASLAGRRLKDTDWPESSAPVSAIARRRSEKSRTVWPRIAGRNRARTFSVGGTSTVALRIENGEQPFSLETSSPARNAEHAAADCKRITSNHFQPIRHCATMCQTVGRSAWIVIRRRPRSDGEDTGQRSRPMSNEIAAKRMGQEVLALTYPAKGEQ